MTSQEQPLENYGDNIHTPDIRRVYITRNNNDIMDDLRAHAQRVCRNDIGEAYIYEALDSFTDGYVYYDDSEADSPILGFVVWKEKHNKQLKAGGTMSYIYIYLICIQRNDKHLCRRIMFDVEAAALERKINIISLHAIDNDKVELYKHFKYKLANEGTLEMSKVIIPSNIRRKRGNSTRRLAQRRKNTRKLRINQVGNIEDYEHNA
jgi:hypothetical protein